MLINVNKFGELDKKFAAVCGLYCGACTIFIATNEDPARLKELAARFQLPEEELKCGGCRSDMRTPYCQECKMFACAAEGDFAHHPPKLPAGVVEILSLW